MGAVTVVVPSTDDGWARLAETRAIPSARAQDLPVVHGRGATLHDARNNGLAQVDTEWVIHLDADDELEAGYAERLLAGAADVRAPAVRYVYRPGRPHPTFGVPKVAGHSHDCTADCLAYGNWLIVGSLVRADLVRSVGGWRDFPWSEDWDVWVRCWHAGATFEAIPTAVYRAHVRANSRNRAAPRHERLEAHRAIARANGLPVP